MQRLSGLWAFSHAGPSVWKPHPTPPPFASLPSGGPAGRSLADFHQDVVSEALVWVRCTPTPVCPTAPCPSSVSALRQWILTVSSLTAPLAGKPLGTHGI